MPDFLCPHCGSVGPVRPDVRALKHSGLTGLARRAVLALVDAYPRTMSMRQLVDIVYANDPNGGPDNPENTISSSLCQNRGILARSGWRAGMKSAAVRESIGLWPITPTAENVDLGRRTIGGVVARMKQDLRT